MNNKAKIAAYNEIKRVLAKHDSIISGTGLDVSEKADYLIRFAELSEFFGFDIPTTYGGEHCVMDGYVPLDWDGAHSHERLLLMGEKHGRTIPCSDNGSQPDDEWIYVIGFSAGAYTFGEHYPSKLFGEFFGELKALEPKYSDTMNKSLYFSEENAKRAREQFPVILSKYREKVAADKLRMDIERMESRLKAMKEKEVCK